MPTTVLLVVVVLGLGLYGKFVTVRAIMLFQRITVMTNSLI